MSAGVDARGRLAPQIAIVAAVAIVAIVAIAACGGGRQTGAVQRDPSPTARLTGGATHIAVIVLENHEYGDIIGSRSAPFITSLARRYGLAAGMYAITHPSLPNYLALTGGSTF